MNKTSRVLLIAAAIFALLGVAVLPSGFGPAIFQMFGSASACLWGAWLFWEEKQK